MNLRVGNSRGSGLILSLLSLAVFAIMTATIVVSLRALKQEGVYQAALLEAESIADSCAQDALLNLEKNASWSAGFSNKSFADGYYNATVDVTVSTKPVITCSGYGPSIALLGRPFRTIRFTAEFLPIAAINGMFASHDFTSADSTVYVDSYNSETDLAASAPSASAFVQANNNVSFNNNNGSQFKGNVNYGNSINHTNPVTGTVTQQSGTFPTINSGAAYVNNNNNRSGGIVPSSVLDSANPPNLTVAYNQTATITSGVYYLHNLNTIWQSNGTGTLNLNITNGPVIIFLTGVLNNQGDICNATMRPGNLFIYGVSGSGQNFTFNQTLCSFYGVIAGQNVNLTSYYLLYGAIAAHDITLDYGGGGSAIGTVHEDRNLQTVPNNPVRIAPGSWKFLSKRY